MDKVPPVSVRYEMDRTHLGKLSDIIEMSCPHANSIRKLWERDALASYSKRIDKARALEKGILIPQLWTVSVMNSSRGMNLRLVFRHENGRSHITGIGLILRPNEPGHAGTTRVLNTQWTDPWIIRTWYDKCLENHGRKCDQPDWMRLRLASTAMPEWLVDVVDNCVVECNSDKTRYIALSYTWGGIQCLKHTSQTLERLKRKGSLHPDEAADIPRTVRDALNITKLLGERYLWVDSLCIPQGEATATRGLNSMHHIYANSIICLVALAGTNANHGLRGIEGISMPRHVEQLVLDMADGERFSWLSDSSQKVHDDKPCTTEGSRYDQRGWTYQEYAFARRRLIFTDGLLRWTCLCANWSEEAHPKVSIDIPMTPKRLSSTSWMTRTGPNLTLIGAAANDFSSRYFTFEGDILRAFLGIQNHISRDFLGGLNYGHPHMFFDISLLWRPYTEIESKRRLGRDANSDPPSWSWMGWQGGFLFDKDEEYVILRAHSDIGFTRSVAQWYTMHSPLAPASDMQPVNCHWQIHRDAVESNSADVPFGWQKVPFHGHDEDYSYRRQSATEGTNDKSDSTPTRKHHSEGDLADFRYPIPLPRYKETFGSTEQRPFIFARTNRCFFTAKKLMKSDLRDSCYEYMLLRYSHGLFCHDGECAGLLRPHYASDEPCFQVEVVGVVKGWTARLSEFFSSFQDRKDPVRPEWSSRHYNEWVASGMRRHNCYFVLCVKWENGVAKRQGIGIVEADIWERNQEPVDLILG